MKFKQKKLRGIPRRIRAIQKWPSMFCEKFPTPQEIETGWGYWNYKIPVHRGMVEGKYATEATKRECAQALINACGNLIEAKPEWASHYRVTCSICIPDMFTSELCVYLNEDYYQGHVGNSSNEHGYQERIANRSLSSEMELVLPKGVQEIGVLWSYNASEDIEDHYISEHWVYGEVS